MEYDGTGGGAGNYLAFYSGVTGWAGKGAGLNYVPENGRVGIGTTEPLTKLQVMTNDDTGTSSTVALSLYAQSSDHTQIQNGFGSRLMFYTNRGTSSTYRGASAEIKGYICLLYTSPSPRD